MLCRHRAVPCLLHGLPRGLWLSDSRNFQKSRLLADHMLQPCTGCGFSALPLTGRPCCPSAESGGFGHALVFLALGPFSEELGTASLLYPPAGPPRRLPLWGDSRD